MVMLNARTAMQAFKAQALGDQKWDAQEIDALSKLSKSGDSFAKDGVKFMLDELNSSTTFEPAAKEKLFGVLVYEARIDPRQITADPPPVTLAVQEGSSNKFYQLSLSGASFTKAWGKIGAPPSTKTENFESAAEAKKAFLAKLREQLGKGYKPADPGALGLEAPNPAGASQSLAPSAGGLHDLSAFLKLPADERVGLLESYGGGKEAGLKSSGEVEISKIKDPKLKAFAEKMRDAAEDAVSFEVEADEYLLVGSPKVSVEIFTLPSGEIAGGSISVRQVGVERPEDYWDNEDKYPEKKLAKMAAETDVSWGMSGVYGNVKSGAIDRLKEPDYMEWSGY
ncbi:MAG: WGR domain-containing protein [Myxococcota bacterium]